MEGSLKVGDVVVLKSGGPRMTVAAKRQLSDGVRITCHWFCNKEFREGFFVEETLKLDNGEFAEILKTFGV